MDVIKVRNRLLENEAVKKATVALGAGTDGAPLASAVTDGAGNAKLDVSKVPDGTHVCKVTPEHSSTLPVGPSTGPHTGSPKRIFRPFSFQGMVKAGKIVSTSPQPLQEGTVSGGSGTIKALLQPVWMASTANSARAHSISTIVIHHTGCNTHIAVMTFLAEKGPHYMIDVDGRIVKFVMESKSAWHAGASKWGNESSLNDYSIGIEIVHVNGTYPAAQYDALIGLLIRLLAANPQIDVWNIVGHSDVATDKDGLGRLGRKSTDPGITFAWGKLQDHGWGLLCAAGPCRPDVYGGFFQAVQGGSFRKGDNDGSHRHGGKTGTKLTGAPVQELQQDLKTIGYSVGKPDGDFGDRTHWAVKMLQEHFYWILQGQSPSGHVDFSTAALIKSVVMARPIKKALVQPPAP